MSTTIATGVPAAVRPLPRWLRLEPLLLPLVGFFGGAAHALPSRAYVGGAFGPFDVLLLALFARWLLVSDHKIERAAIAAYVPFVVFGVLAYLGDFIGGMVFGGISWSGMLAPLRFLYYPTLLFTLPPLLPERRDLRSLFMAFAAGVLAISVIAWIESPDPGFFFGFPVLYNPNVIGNFISYALICLGFAFMPRRVAVKWSLAAVLFVFALFTFSKASVLLALFGLYVNTVKVSKWRLVAALCVLVAAFFAFANWQHVFELVSTAIELKLASSVGTSTSGGTLDMRFGFFRTSMYSLMDYPFGVGLKHFQELNESYADRLGNYYFESQSPHTALGFAAVQAGWIGVGLLVVIFRNVVRALFTLYGTPRIGLRVVLVLMLVISILFQIEFITQPFIYLVLAAALALRRQASPPAVTVREDDGPEAASAEPRSTAASPPPSTGPCPA